MTDAYFDNTIVSAIAKNDTPSKTAAIVRILEADAADGQTHRTLARDGEVGS
jgi:hypothetical protein